MGRFFTLIGIEHTKLWKRLSAKVMLGIMLLIVIVACSAFRINQYSKGTDVHAQPKVTAGWQQQLKMEIAAEKQQEATIKNEKNDSPERANLGNLDLQIAQGQYQLDHDIAFNKPNSIWTKLVSFGRNAGFCSLIALMLIIACSAAVAGEFSDGTIKMAISRPYHRHEILSAKLISSLLYGLELLVATLAANFLLFIIFYGTVGFGASEMLWTTHKILYVPAFVKFLAFYGLGYLQIVFYTVLAFALSTVTRSRSIATGFSLFMLLLGSQLAQLVCVYLFNWAKWFPFTMTDFTNMITSGVIIPGSSLPLGLLMTGLYTIVFGAVGYTVFAKRDI